MKKRPENQSVIPKFVDPQARLKLNVKTDHLKDREEENRKLFRHALFLAGNDQMKRNALKGSEIRCESRQFTCRR